LPGGFDYEIEDIQPGEHTLSGLPSSTPIFLRVTVSDANDVFADSDEIMATTDAEPRSGTLRRNNALKYLMAGLLLNQQSATRCSKGRQECPSNKPASGSVRPPSK
jgi:hypothetical protein